MKLAHMSSSSIGLKPSDVQTIDGQIESLNEAYVNLVINQVKAEKKQNSKGKVRDKCPPKIKVLPNQAGDKLYPCLSGINEEPLKQPPPPYFGQEVFYSTAKTKSASVLPSAPSLSEIESGSESHRKHTSHRQTRNLVTHSSAINFRSKNSPSRNI